MKHFFKKTNVSLSSNGEILLHKANQDYAPMYIVLEVVAKENVTGLCAFSVGTNNPDYNNIVNSAYLFPSNVEMGEHVTFNSGYAKAGIKANDDIYLKIGNAFNGVFLVTIYGIGFDPNATPSY